jgi:hypothetical protein
MFSAPGSRLAALRRSPPTPAWPADARIAIIGAGTAGLTSAVTLWARGYRNIIVIERETDVGGKCHSCAPEAGLLELGANIVFPGRVIQELARRTGARLIEWFPIRIADLHSGRVRRFGSTESRFSLSQRARAYARLAVELVRHRRLREEGFCGAAHLVELATPVRTWLAERRLEVIAETVMPFMVGAGLGYPEDDVPVAYFFKLLSFIRKMGIADLARQRCYRFERGYQDLWQRVAAMLRPGVGFRLGAAVERVERPAGSPIRIRAGDEEIVCDALIVTAPDQARSFLDASEAEQDLLSRFRSFDMYTVGCTVQGRLPLGLCFIGPNTKSRGSLGHAFAYVPMTARRGDGRGEFVFYAHGDTFADRDVILDKLRRDVAMQECCIVGEPVVKRWPRYFPHVSSRDFGAGFFMRLDGLQGQRATYYLGEAVSGTNVSVVAEHAAAQIRRFFPDHGRSVRGGARGVSR